MRLGDSKILTVPWPNIEWWDDLTQDEKDTEYNSIHSPLKVTQEFIDVLDGRQIPPEPQENIDRLNEIKSYLAYRNDEARYCKRYGLQQTKSYYCLLPVLAKRYIYLNERFNEEKLLENQINHMNNDNKDKTKRLQELKDMQESTDKVCMYWDMAQWTF